MRNEGLEPPAAGSGIQRSTTELIPLRMEVFSVRERMKADMLFSPLNPEDVAFAVYIHGKWHKFKWLVTLLLHGR